MTESTSQKIDGIANSMVRDLFVDWFGALLRNTLGVTGGGRSNLRFEFQITDTRNVSVTAPTDGNQIVVEGPTDLKSTLLQIALDSRMRALAGMTGNPVWWQIGFESKPDWTEAASLHMFRTMGQYKRYDGNWKLGSDAVLKFKQLGESGLQMFPNQTVVLVFQSPGPGHGPFGANVARTWATFMRALVALASAAPVSGLNLLSPARDAFLAEALLLRTDNTTPELQIDGKRVWERVARLYHCGAREAFDRFFGALQAYEQALSQRNAGASIVFFVTAIEALTVPNAPWKQDRVTKRFVEFLLEACPEAIDEVLKHTNFGQAFGRPMNRKQFADHLYKLRSSPVHTGRLGQITSATFLDDDGASMRVALVSDVARAAIMRFLDVPFSVLTGHPAFDSMITLNYPSNLHQKLQAVAQKEGKSSVKQWLLGRLAAEFGEAE